MVARNWVAISSIIAILLVVFWLFSFEVNHSEAKAAYKRSQGFVLDKLGLPQAGNAHFPAEYNGLNQGWTDLCVRKEDDGSWIVRSKVIYQHKVTQVQEQSDYICKLRRSGSDWKLEYMTIF